MRPDASILIQIVTYSTLLFAICMVCHGELVRLKPHERYLTSFYLMVAIGGALGGIFVVAIAPWLFTGYWEFHLAIWISLLLLFIVLMRDPNSWIHERRPAVAIAMLAGAILLPGADRRRIHCSAQSVERPRPHTWSRHSSPMGLMSAVAFQKNSLSVEDGQVLSCRRAQFWDFW